MLRVRLELAKRLWQSSKSIWTCNDNFCFTSIIFKISIGGSNYVSFQKYCKRLLTLAENKLCYDVFTHEKSVLLSQSHILINIGGCVVFFPCDLRFYQINRLFNQRKISHCSGVSIVNFEQVNAGLEGIKQKYNKIFSLKTISNEV